MAELADAQDLGSCAARRMGSSPTDRIRCTGNVFFCKDAGKDVSFCFLVDLCKNVLHFL